MFRAADSNLRDARRFGAAPFADVSLVFRRRRGCAARAARRSSALLAAAFLFAFSGLFVSDARAQLFKNGPFASNSSSRDASSAASSRKNQPAPQPPQTERPQLFSGKYVRSFAENFGRDDDAPRAASPNARQSSAPRQPVSSRQSAAPRPNVPVPTPTSASRSNGSLSTPSESLESLTQASTSRESAREIAAKIPWNALSPSARQKLQEIVANPTIYRRLPMAGGRCNPELFDFFLCNPHAVVAFWNQMGFDDLAMSQKAPYRYEIREKGGTVGGVQILYQDSELTVAYCNGTYRGPVTPRLEGEMLLLLQTRYTEDEASRPIVVCRLDAFVDLKNPGADLLARTISGPLGKIADANFAQTIAFIDSLSQTAENAPNDLIASISRLGSLSPEARRLLVAKTAEASRQANLRARGELVEYRLLPKKNLPTEAFARILAREQNGVYAAQAASLRSSQSSQNEPFAPSRTSRNDGAAGFARSSSGRSGSLYSSRSEAPFADDFDRPSLAKNSFALADDVVDETPAAEFSLDGDETDADDFESSLDWDDDGESALDAAPLSSLTPSARTSETSLAKVEASSAPQFSDALELLEENDLTASETVAFPALELSTDAPETPESAAETIALPAFAVAETDAEVGAELELFDAETLVDLNAAAESADATETADDGTIAFPIFPKNSAPSAAAPVRAPRLPPSPRRASSSKPRPLAASESLDSPSEAKPLAENENGDAPQTSENAELPLLLLPELNAAPDATQAVENDEPALPQNAELAPEFAAQTEPLGAETTTVSALNAPVATFSEPSGGVWRAVDVAAKTSAKSRKTSKTAAVAKPKVAAVEKARVDQTAQAETQENEGVTFRKPRFQ